jgi:hypothetical protein
MSEKLSIGAMFPQMKIDLAGGGSIELPQGMNAKYRVVLFYRGHW